MLTDLPPLPPHRFCLNSSPVMVGYTAEEMTAYAREARAATLATVTPLVQQLESVLARMEAGCTDGGLGPGYQNGHGEECGTQLQAARKAARAFLSGATKESIDA